MSKSAFAKEDVMQEYLSALLTDVVPEADEKVRSDTVQTLFDQIPQTEALERGQSKQETDKSLERSEHSVTAVEPELTVQAVPVSGTQRVVPATEFQALYFEVAGLTVAVQLTELGGIHQISKVTSLFGKPDWFNGVMTHREDKINVVDTARWIMPEKYTEKLAETLNYQYLIMLGDSQWGLACEALVSTFTLSPDDVKWRDRAGKRPWLAGMVKEKMCALLDVEQLIELLNKGLDSKDE